MRAPVHFCNTRRPANPCGNRTLFFGSPRGRDFAPVTNQRQHNCHRFRHPENPESQTKQHDTAQTLRDISALCPLSCTTCNKSRNCEVFSATLKLTVSRALERAGSLL